VKTISGGLAAHLDLPTTTLATCWKVTLNTSPVTVLGFTDHDRDLVISAVTYEAASGYTRSAIASQASLQVDNVDVQGALDSLKITEADIRAGVWDFAQIEIFIVNWANLADGVMIQRSGTLGEVRTGKNNFYAELRGLMQHLQQAVGRIYGPLCDADLGDARCQVNLAALTNSSTVTSVVSRRDFSDSALADADGYYDAGLVTFTGGLNVGFSREVKAYLNPGPAQVVMQLPFPYTIQVGDAYDISPGCLKRLTDCKTKFNNVVNFRGYPHIPGIDHAITGGR